MPLQKFRPKILPASFFNRPTLKIARDLLGKFLVRRIGKRVITGMVIEVEAYVGPEDRASHASRGKTERTKVMFGKPGSWYVYMIYGMYYCLNVVTEREEYPAAVLIRSVAVSPQHSHILKNMRMLLVNGSERKRDDYGSRTSIISTIVGPGRVCRYFKIDTRFNAKPAHKKTGLWIEDRGVRIAPKKVKRGKRIGVDYAEEWKHEPWRFWI